jgi:hypothetical protein
MESYMISSLLLGIYHNAIDAIFISVLEDLDKNDGSAAKPYFMSPEMKNIMHKEVN